MPVMSRQPAEREFAALVFSFTLASSLAVLLSAVAAGAEAAPANQAASPHVPSYSTAPIQAMQVPQLAGAGQTSATQVRLEKGEVAEPPKVSPSKGEGKPRSQNLPLIGLKYLRAEGGVLPQADAPARISGYLPEVGIDVSGAVPNSPPKATKPQESVIVFGQGEELKPPKMPASKGEGKPNAQNLPLIGLKYLRAEGGVLPQADAPARFSGYLAGALSASLRPFGSDSLYVQGTVRADVYPQIGKEDSNTARLDYGDTFLRFDNGNSRLTVGAQTVVWGRVDEFLPTDRLSVQDITRYILDKLPDRRRAVPAVRFEHYWGNVKADALVEPFFRAAELPAQDSIWFPVNREQGRILGIETSPVLRAVVRNGSIGGFQDYREFGGAGLRVSRTGSRFDAALTVQRARRSLPYYEVNPAVRRALLRGEPVATALASGSPTLVEKHPSTWVYGGDFAFNALSATWRFEAAYLTDMPVTTSDYRLGTVSGLDWVAATEFFPGGRNTRVTLQVIGHQLFNTSNILDRSHSYELTGELYYPFSQDRWSASARFVLGVDHRDLYFNPKLTYLGFEPAELYLAADVFAGSQRSPNGFFDRNDMIRLGWRIQF